MIKTLIRKICQKTPLIDSLFEVVNRFRIAKTYNKDAFMYNKDAFDHIYNDNMWGSSESCSVGGSEISATVSIRKALPLIWNKYNIKTFLDVPCGDFNWMKEVDKTGIEYIGGDIAQEAVKRNNELYGTSNIRFEKIDITKDALPKADMIFCKDCLQHLSDENVAKALRNFIQSGCKYLMLTSYPLTIKNHDILDGDYRPLNLLKKPYQLPKNYICKIKEKARGGFVELDKTMYLWKISDINKF